MTRDEMVERMDRLSEECLGSQDFDVLTAGGVLCTVSAVMGTSRMQELNRVMSEFNRWAMNQHRIDMEGLGGKYGDN